jgi:hypothetical protein
MEKTQLTKKQIRDKIYYLKKTGQTNKYKRYLKQHRDYHSEDEDEEPEEQNYSKEEENNTDDENLDEKFNLNYTEYKKFDENINEILDKNQLEFLQTFFDTQITDKNILMKLYEYLNDRQKIKLITEKTPTKQPFYYTPIGF